VPGLTGIVCRQPSLEAKVLRMAGHLGTYRRRAFLSYTHAEHAAMACRIARDEPASSTVACRDGILLGLDGEVFSTADGSAGQPQSAPRGRTQTPGTLIDLYRRRGIDFVSRLRGHFSIAVWDGHRNRLYLATDRLGMRPLYYHVGTDGIRFGSTARSLALSSAAAAEADQECIAEFLLSGLPLGGGTFFKGVQLVPPGSILTFTGDRLAANVPYWQMRFGGSPSSCRGYADAAELLRTSLLEVICESASPEDVLEVPLSGGLDSRALVVLAHTAGCRIRSYTIGGEGSVDLRLGPKVARTIGIPNTHWQVQPEDLLDWMEEAVYLTDGSGNPFTSAILFIARHLPDDARTVLEGANTFDNYYRLLDALLAPGLSRGADPRKALQRVLEAPLVDALGRLRSGLLRSDYRDYALRCTTTAMERACDEIPARLRRDRLNMIDYLEHHLRLRRMVSCGTVLLRAYCEVRHPYLDPRVLDAVLMLPPVFKSKEKLLHGALIERTLPEAARIPYERTGMAANASTARHLARYARESLRRVLAPVVPVLRRPPNVAIDYGRWFQRHAGLRERLAEILFDSRTINRGYFDTGALRAAVTRLFAGDTRELLIIGRALSLELWHRLFLEGNEPAGRGGGRAETGGGR